jgi:hypothetical protein
VAWLKSFCLILLLQNMTYAESLYTTVFNVFESQKTDRILVLSSVDGRIYKASNNEENLKKIQSFVGKIVLLDYYEDGKEAIISTIKLADPGEMSSETIDLNYFVYNELREFAPTDLQTYGDAKDVFNKMLNDGDKNRSQCFKRAHMWAYDMWSQLGLKSEKIFIFWTKRYSILEDFEWWFHVAPMVKVAGKDYVLDGTFMKAPVTLQNWTNQFMENNNMTCPTIQKYQQYTDNQWNRLCYLMKVPMYYFRPLDIENRDKLDIKKNHWVLEELQNARQAFKNWKDVYEGFDTGKKTIKY